MSLVINFGQFFHILGLLDKDMSRQSQITGKVGQVCCRKDLDRVGAQVISWIFKLLKDRSIGVPVIVENVPENCGQLVGMDSRLSSS